jgi:hypothetical protein
MSLAYSGRDDRPLLAESSHWHPPIVGVASVRFTPKPAAGLE